MPSNRTHRTSLLLGLAPVLVAAPAHAELAGYTIEKLALEGDPAPGGTLNQIFGEIDIDDHGRVVFVATIDDGGSIPFAILSVEDSALELSSGETAPDTGGLLFTEVTRPRVAAPDVLGYLGLYDDPPDLEAGAFLRSGAGDAALALPGVAAPGGGTLSEVQFIHDATAAPAVAFGAEVDDGGLVAAHFVATPGGLREIYRDGAAAPASVGGSFSGVQTFAVASLDASGAAAFGSAVSGGNAASGLFRSPASGAITALLLEGDGVTTPGGGTFTAFASGVDTNAAGDVAFNAEVLRAPTPFSQEGVFVLEGGVLREVAFRGDPLPGTSPPRFFQGLAGATPAQVNGAGVVAIAASIEDDPLTLTERAVLVDHDGSLGVLVQQGDPVPGMPGNVFTEFNEVRIDDAGRIAFFAFTEAGAGVFLAAPPPATVPALPRAGLGLLAAALAGAAAVCARRPRTS